KLPLRDFNVDVEGLADLTGVINDGLSGKQHVLLRIVAFVRVGAGKEVFPSQELILERGRGDKSKTLYQVGKGAAFLSQKIGNAIRTIDTWYEGANELGPIAVEPYGSVTTQGKAYRQTKQKMDFYNLLDNWILKDQSPELEQQHFVIATLIRGGVFGDAGQLMDHYVDIRLLPDPEFTTPMLMGALFGKLHRALVELKADHLGVSFPQYQLNPKTLGAILRIHGTEQGLSGLMQTGWLKGMADHIAGVEIRPVPQTGQCRVVKRRQYKTNVERLRRRRMKRKEESYEQATAAIPASVERQP